MGIVTIIVGRGYSCFLCGGCGGGFGCGVLLLQFALVILQGLLIDRCRARLGFGERERVDSFGIDLIPRLGFALVVGDILRIGQAVPEFQGGHFLAITGDIDKRRCAGSARVIRIAGPGGTDAIEQIFVFPTSKSSTRIVMLWLSFAGRPVWTAKLNASRTAA